MCRTMRPPPEGGASPQAGQRRRFLRNTCKKSPQCAPLNPRPPGPRPDAHLVTHPTAFVHKGLIPWSYPLAIESHTPKRGFRGDYEYVD